MFLKIYDIIEVYNQTNGLHHLPQSHFITNKNITYLQVALICTKNAPED